MSLAGTRLLARWCPACRRREPGLRLLRRTWEGRPRHCRLQGCGRRQGARASGGNREALSTVAGSAGGPACSSEEALVIGVEPRGRAIWASSFGQPGRLREESSGRADVEGQAVCDLQVGGLGGVPAGQGQSRGAGCGRVLDRGVREGSEGQPVQGLEPDVLGELLPTSGAGGGSGQITLPESWTDRGPTPMPHRLSVEGLAALAALTRSLQGR